MKLSGRTRSLSLDVGTISAGRFTAFGLSLIIPIILTRVFSANEYGNFRELSLLVLTLQPVLLFGIPSSLRYFIPRSTHEEKRRYISQALVFTIAVGLGLFVFLLIAGGFLTVLIFNTNYNEFMFIVGIHGFLFLTASYLGVVMIVNDDVKTASLTAIVFSVIDVLFFVGGALIFGSVKGLFMAIAVSSLIKFVFALVYININFKPGLSLISAAGLKKQFKFSAPLGLSDMINILNINIDKFFIAFYFVPEVFAIYSIGVLITPVILMLYRSVFDIIVPQFSKLYKKRKFKDLIGLWHEGIRKLALILYPIFVFLFIFAFELILILFPSAYSGSVPVFRIYLFMLPLTITFFNGVLIGAGESKFLLKATGIIFTVNIVLNYILITWFISMDKGILGPPIATIGVNVVLNILLLSRIKTILGRSVYALYPWDLMAKLMGICALAGAITIGVMFALGVNLFGGYVTIPGGYEGIAPIFSDYPIIVFRIAIALIGLAVLSAIYYNLARMAGLVQKDDIDIVLKFIGLKK